jgi:hypothetical protein
MRLTESAGNERDQNRCRHDHDEPNQCCPASLHEIPSARMRKTGTGRTVDPMSWEFAGAIASLLLAAGAYLRSRSPGGFYDAQVYGMTPRSHRAYAAVALAFAFAFFVAGLVWPRGAATIWIGAAFVLFAVFYLSSYLRGASEDDD